MLSDPKIVNCLFVVCIFLQQHVLKRERFVEPMLLAPMGHAAQVCNVLAIATDLEVRNVFEP